MEPRYRGKAMLAFILSISILSGISPGFSPAAQKNVCVWGKISFETPLAFSGPSDLGFDAVAFLHPAGSDPIRAKVAISLASFAREAVEGMGLKDVELLATFKTTFVGAGPGEKTVERAFLGKMVKGDRQTTRIPSIRRLESFLIPLPDGGRLGLSVSGDPGMPENEFEEIIARVSRTLRISGKGPIPGPYSMMSTSR